MKKILNKLFDHQSLDKEEAREILVRISKSEFNDAQIAAFISVYLMRNISLEELSGFREALLDLCVKIDVDGTDTIDLCGTGGDGKNTFNISTLSSFVVAGAGYRVTKHGNYGVSSVCGSSNVLQHLGYNFTNDSDTLNRQLDASNICFLHAPLFHPALKSVGVRLINSKEELLVNPTYFGERQLAPDQIFGGDTIGSAAEIFRTVISGKGTMAQNAVIQAWMC